MRYLLIETNLQFLAKELNAQIDESAFEALFRERLKDPKIKISRGIEQYFHNSKKLWELVQRHHSALLRVEQKELKIQEKRLAAATDKLKKKETKTARLEHERATSKVKKLQWKIERHDEAELKPYDHRLYPFHFAPLLIMKSGERTLVPSRFHCRPHGQKADFDRKSYSMYKARVESLTPEYFQRIADHSGKESLWRDLFGKTHGLLFMKAFFENVNKKVKGFTVSKTQWAPIPCLYSEWKSGTKKLNSFAVITGEAPDVVKNAGYDRAPVNLRNGKMNEWLLPEGFSDEEILKLLCDKNTGVEYELAA